jgi:hypothetical protein
MLSGVCCLKDSWTSQISTNWLLTIALNSLKLYEDNGFKVQGCRRNQLFRSRDFVECNSCSWPKVKISEFPPLFWDGFSRMTNMTDHEYIFIMFYEKIS